MEQSLNINNNIKVKNNNIKVKNNSNIKIKSNNKIKSNPSPPTTPNVNQRQIEQVLDEYLDAVLSSRRTAEEPARGLTALPAAQQEFALRWTDVIRKSNSEMGYQFVSHAPRALALIGMEGTRQWLLAAMDVYDKEGLYPGSAAFARIADFAHEYRRDDSVVTLIQIRPMLERYIRGLGGYGLGGRDLKIEAGERSRTDTDVLYLPARINRFDDREQNRRLYKAMAVHLWAQTRFGTYRRATPESPHLSEILADFDNPNRALALFTRLESIRLNACIARELPGLAREMSALDAAAPQDATWRSISARLGAAEAEVADSLAATSALYAHTTAWPEALLYQGELDPAAARLAVEQRQAADKTELQSLLAEMLAEHDAADGDGDGAEAGEATHRFTWDADGEATDGRGELNLDGEPMDMTPAAAQLLASLLQDLAQLPEDWLQPAGDGGYRPNHAGDASAQTEAANQPDAWRYDEWDFRRENYRKNWCVLRESGVHPVDDGFVAATLKKYRPQVTEIRRHFEALRGEDKILKAQPDGDDIDLDALVAAYAEARTGVEMSDRLFTRAHKTERDLAVVFMVDVSGSTQGWINDAVRESLALLCEALEILSDQYAIYGFSGMTRNRCEIYRVKTFAQPYDDAVRACISGLRPQDYTRMGVAIRHLSGVLNQVAARTRILITLSDGKPDDYDGYRGDYGVEDTRRALLEARHAGIHPFCITIDTEAGDYLPHMYGHASYVVIDEVRKLPLKVADIYRRLTT